MKHADIQMQNINNCTWTWTTQNGVKGYKVVGKNGNSIYIPESIESVYGTITDDLPIYDINGRRVTVHDIKQRPGKSVYIRNGRKLIL